MKEDRLNQLLLEYSQNPSPELMSELVEGFLFIPKSIAKRFVRQGVEYDDLFQVASISLMKAIEKFDPQKGYKFITYATPTIAGDLRNYVRDKNNLIKTSRASKNLIYNINKVKDDFLQANFREPDINEIADSLSLEPSDIINALMTYNANNPASLDASFDDEKTDSLSIFLGYEDEGYRRIEDEAFITWVKDNTSPQEFKLLRHRFVDNMSQREVAKVLNVSQMQISRLEKRIFTRLKSLGEEFI